MRSLLPVCAAVVICSAVAGLVQAGRPIDDNVKHVVIFMQENRAFDHYYGSLQGVRGFNDRTAPPTILGKDTLYQPIPKKAQNVEKARMDAEKAAGGPVVMDHEEDLYQVPWPLRTMNTSAVCAPAPTMDFYVNMGVIGDGKFDAWNTARDPGVGMGFFDREDFPYYYSLYDSFMVGDHYFQSTFTETNPNRLHLFSGSNGLGAGEFPVLYDEEPAPGWKWETMAETLENANVSWRLYQELDNFDDNAFAWFETFRSSLPGSVWWDQGMYRAMGGMVEEFENSLKTNTLPQVSWLVAPEWKSEHATNHPPAGEWLSSQIFEIVKKYPDYYKNMIFILNYDEGGQFYDHLWTPMPPLNAPHDGQSTITTANETFQCQDFPFLVKNGECPENFRNVTVTNGLGYRVPLLVVSPWTRGSKVTSEVFDHTSVIQLLETRFNVTCPNLTPWRRSVAGNLADVFDFENPDYSWPQNFPVTSDYVIKAELECLMLPKPVVPANQTFPKQEEGIRMAHPLPYDQNVNFDFHPGNNSLTLTLEATGTRTSAYMLYNVKDIATTTPQRFQVESTKTIVATMPLGADASTSNFSVALHGTNGFVRKIWGTEFPMSQAVQWVEFKQNNSATFTLRAATDSMIKIVDNAYNLGGPWAFTLQAGDAVTVPVFNLTSCGRWYDFTVEKTGSWSQRYMGHIENGEWSISDPAMSAGVPSNLYGGSGSNQKGSQDPRKAQHPDLPDHMRFVKRKEGRSKDSKFYSPAVLKDEL